MDDNDVPVEIWLPVDTYRALHRQAALDDLTISEEVTRAVHREVEASRQESMPREDRDTRDP